MNSESIDNIIVDYVAQFADINTTNKIYINSWWFNRLSYNNHK